MLNVDRVPATFVATDEGHFGYSQLFLYTHSAAALYAGLGWRPLEQRVYRGEQIQVMDRKL